jgi:hypothetical protein
MDGMTKGVTKSYTPGGKPKRPIIQKSHLPIFEIVLGGVKNYAQIGLQVSGSNDVSQQ